MKRLLIVGAVLSALSGAVSAEWVKVGATSKDGAGGAMEIFVDPSTIRRNGQIVKMWSLFNYLEVSEPVPGWPVPSKSVKFQDEYDCAEEKYRGLFSSNHTEHMGGGYITRSDTTVGEWRPVPPRSVSEMNLRFACGKKKKK